MMLMVQYEWKPGIANDGEMNGDIGKKTGKLLYDGIKENVKRQKAPCCRDAF